MNAIGSKVEIKNAFNPSKRGFRGIVMAIEGEYAKVSGYRMNVPVANLIALLDSDDLDNTEYRSSTEGFARK